MENKAPSNIVLTNRSELSVSGVNDVSGYDEMQVEAETQNGLLFIRGSGLKIRGFNREKKELELSGRIDGLIYGVQTEKKNLFSRLFG
ncbi:MAG: YabP/YqfC family sporulation protein [Clostridia bacterium]|nr:YabP/YqfC family sporulation protein [Clostridia bacterium]